MNGRFLRQLVINFLYNVCIVAVLVLVLGIVARESYEIWLEKISVSLLVGYVGQVFQYFFVVGLLFLLLNVIFSKILKNRKIQKNKRPELAHTIRECLHTMNALIAISALGVFVGMLMEYGYITVYSDSLDNGWLYLVVNLIMFYVLSDAWMYWTHRFLHRPLMFRLFHHLHHISRQPTVFSTYQVSPVEVVFSGVFTTAFLVVFDTPIVNLLIFSIFGLLRQIIGHSGIELFPRIMLKSNLLKVSTTVTHHDMHHRHVNCNYGLYFSWWDKLMGTESPRYEEEFFSVTQKSKSPEFNADLA